MINNLHQNTYKNDPWFSCGIEDCSDDTSYPADMLHLHEGKPVCEVCYDAMFSHTKEFTPDAWLDLPAFIPEADKRIAELKIEVKRFRSVMDTAACVLNNVCNVIGTNQVVDKIICELNIIQRDELKAVLFNSNASKNKSSLDTTAKAPTGECQICKGIESMWFCKTCQDFVPGIEVTYEEYHDGCGGECGECPNCGGN